MAATAPGRTAPRDDTPPVMFPADLWGHHTPLPRQRWTCLRVRPRWEKRLARWMVGHGMAYFLPLVPRPSPSVGSARFHRVPLLPGYVFALGDHDKADFRDAAGAVVYLIKPALTQADDLHDQLWRLWRGLQVGSHLELTGQLHVGETVEVIAGPLRGVQGRFTRWSASGRLILAVDMLGLGVAVEIDDACVQRVAH